MDVSIIAIGGQKLRIATSTGHSGSIPLLVFNGLGADVEIVDGFVAELSNFGIGVVVFDVPGIGGSSMPLLPYRFAWVAHLADQVLTRIGILGQVDVAGMSWGGALAQEFTRRYPARVRRLVLAATSAGAVAIPGRLSALATMLDLRVYLDRNAMARAGGELYGGKIRGNAELLKHYSESFRPIACSMQLLAVTGWTSVAWLRTLRQPTLVMMGTDDPIVPVTNGRLLATLIPDARLVTIDDGHLFLLTSAAQCVPIIAEFLAGRTPPATGGNGVVIPAPELNGPADAGPQTGNAMVQRDDDGTNVGPMRAR